jgi:phosphate transport system protein
MSDHLAKSYEEELRRLNDMVVTMGHLTGEQLEAVLGAAERPDVEIAARVVEREPEADRL